MTEPINNSQIDIKINADDNSNKNDIDDRALTDTFDKSIKVASRVLLFSLIPNIGVGILLSIYFKFSYEWLLYSAVIVNTINLYAFKVVKEIIDSMKIAIDKIILVKFSFAKAEANALTANNNTPQSNIPVQTPVMNRRNSERTLKIDNINNNSIELVKNDLLTPPNLQIIPQTPNNHQNLQPTNSPLSVATMLRQQSIRSSSNV